MADRTLAAGRLLAAALSFAMIDCAAAAAPTSRESELAAKSAGPRPWNVVLITVDALRADRMSLYGNPRPTTPRLDAFAREAAVFENFFAVSAHTSPGVVSLLTGQAPAVHAQTTQYSYYDESIPSPLRALAARGYDVVGNTIRGPTYADLGFTRGQDGKRTEELLAELAKGEKPFFVWLHTRETHLPYKPAQELSGKFTRGMTLDSPLLRAVREHRFVLRYPPPASFAYPHAENVTALPSDVEPLRALYDECVASADAHVGAWLAQLHELGLLERTLVVITADHGDELLDHGWVGHASTSYDARLTDEIVHVPLILRVPGAAHAGRYRALSSQLDVMPTLFELLGVDGSALAANQQGVSLAPVLRGEQAEVREFVFAETTRKGWTTPRDEVHSRAFMQRTHERKVWGSDWGIREAFDLRADPGEKANLIRDSRHRPKENPELELKWGSARDNAAAGQIAAAGRIVQAAADAHLALLEEARARDDVLAVVAQWQAIQRMNATWGLERDPFYAGRERSETWHAFRTRVAELAAQALRCDALGLPLVSAECRAAR